MDEFDRLHKHKLNVKKNDLRIVAIALLAQATVVTANVATFPACRGCSSKTGPNRFDLVSPPAFFAAWGTIR